MKIPACILFMFIFYNIQVCAQSMQAYEKAGDKCMKQHDSFSAIKFYNNALDFGNSAELSYKLGIAYKSLNDYPTALRWFMDALQNEKEGNGNRYALEAADMLKRLGRFEEADRMISARISTPSADSLDLIETLEGIHFAADLSHDSVPIEVNHGGQIINSAYSDFAPVPFGDSLLYFSSLRFPFKDKNNISHVTSKILSSRVSNFQFSKPEPLPAVINQSKSNSANASVSPDGKLMIFTRCTDDENFNLICKLFESQNKNGQWQTAVEIGDSVNLKGFTSTQPCITTNLAEGYILYYSTDRPGGFGKNDIWMVNRNASGKYTNLQNAGKVINTRYDELTPFYDAIGDTLYFSSDRKKGLGGYDILSAVFLNGKPSVLLHPGPPLNSGYNEMYYSCDYSANRNRYIVSNRPPAEKLNGSSCCYDIFYLKNRIPELKPLSDSALSAPTSFPISSQPLLNIPLDSVTQLSNKDIQDKLQEILPIRLYFDNDYPDPRTRKTTTKSVYNQLTTDYLNKIPEYLDALSSAKDPEQSRMRIKQFFKDSLEGNFKKLESVSAIILKLLENGSFIHLKLQGCASPLADGSYNVILSMRRISSLRNYWMNVYNGKIAGFIRSGQLQLVDDPSGENLAVPGVSDNLDDKASSVYSVEPALERRIEITEITILKQ